MKEIDIYDFDKTIVPFDSGSLFWGYSILHYPWIILLIPFQALLAILMVLKVIDFTKFKKYFFCFVMLTFIKLCNYMYNILNVYYRIPVFRTFP